MHKQSFAVNMLKYLNRLKTHLGVCNDWKFTLNPEFDENAAAVICHDAANNAEFFFQEGFSDLPIADQRYYCVHEILHVALDRMGESLNAVSSLISEDAMTVLKAAHLLEEERVVDLLAQIVAPSVPYP